MFTIQTQIESTQTLGTVRIVDAIFDDPDGRDIVVDYDYFGNRRSEQPIAGPLEQVKEGKNKIKVW